MTSVQPAKKIDREKNKKESTTKHSAILELLDKNGDGLLDEEEQPWKIKPKGCCAWAKVLVSFSWLRKFLKSPVVGTSVDQSAAIKETLNTIGLVAALAITITIPIIVNPSDIAFERKSGFWGADIQILDETWTIVLYFTSLCLSIAFHVVSIGAAVFSTMSLSCLSDDLLGTYIEKVGSMMVLVTVSTFIIGVFWWVMAILVICFFTFGAYMSTLIILVCVSIIMFAIAPFLYKLVSNLYVIPGPAMNEIEKEHNEMMKVTVDDVIQWLGEITKKNEDESYYFSKDFKIETVVDVFKNEGICGMALPSVNEKFLREKCKLKWGDAYLLMKEIKLRKGHVIHWLESKAV